MGKTGPRGQDQFIKCVIASCQIYFVIIIINNRASISGETLGLFLVKSTSGYLKPVSLFIRCFEDFKLSVFELLGLKVLPSHLLT